MGLANPERFTLATLMELKLQGVHGVHGVVDALYQTVVRQRQFTEVRSAWLQWDGSP